MNRSRPGKRWPCASVLPAVVWEALMGEVTLKRVAVVDVAFGQRVTVVEPCNLYGCSLGDDCFVGPFVEIQRGVTIGDRTRVQSHAFVCELVTIGNDCVVAHGA